MDLIVKVGRGKTGGADRSSPPRSLGAVLHTFLERRELACLVSLLAMVTATALALSHRKQLWFDELFTLIVARQPTRREFVGALPADGNPPLLHVMVRASIHVLGETAFAARLPSLLAFLLTCVLLRVFVRQRCGAAAGLLALLLMIEQPGWTYVVSLVKSNGSSLYEAQRIQP